MVGGSGGGLEEFFRKQTKFSNNLDSFSSTFKNLDNGLLSINSQFRFDNLIPKILLKIFRIISTKKYYPVVL